MPKETVTSLDGPYDVKVGWSQDREVQLGVERGDGGSMLWLLFPDLAALGAMVKRLPTDVPAGWTRDEVVGQALLNELDVMAGGSGYGGLWSTLDRAGCNRLIAIVRRARNGAYGKDE